MDGWVRSIFTANACMLKIAQRRSNKKREEDFACLECVIIQSLFEHNTGTFSPLLGVLTSKSSSPVKTRERTPSSLQLSCNLIEGIFYEMIKITSLTVFNSLVITLINNSIILLHKMSFWHFDFMTRF